MVASKVLVFVVGVPLTGISGHLIIWQNNGKLLSVQVECVLPSALTRRENTSRSSCCKWCCFVSRKAPRSLRLRWRRSASRPRRSAPAGAAGGGSPTTPAGPARPPSTCWSPRTRTATERLAPKLAGKTTTRRKRRRKMKHPVPPVRLGGAASLNELRCLRGWNKTKTAKNPTQRKTTKSQHKSNSAILENVCLECMGLSEKTE